MSCRFFTGGLSDRPPNPLRQHVLYMLPLLQLEEIMLCGIMYM